MRIHIRRRTLIHVHIHYSHTVESYSHITMWPYSHIAILLCSSMKPQLLSLLAGVITISPIINVAFTLISFLMCVRPYSCPQLPLLHSGSSLLLRAPRSSPPPVPSPGVHSRPWALGRRRLRERVVQRDAQPLRRDHLRKFGGTEECIDSSGVLQLEINMAPKSTKGQSVEMLKKLV